MPPIWLCPECEGIAYGWARGPCIHCGSNHFVSTEPGAYPEESPSEYRLLFFTEKAWVQIEVEAILAGQSTRELLTQREQAEIVLIRDEPVDHGQLVLLKTNPRKSPSHLQD